MLRCGEFTAKHFIFIELEGLQHDFAKLLILFGKAWSKVVIHTKDVRCDEELP